MIYTPIQARDQGRIDLSGDRASPDGPIAFWADGPIAFWADATAAIHYEKINKLGEDERKDCASFSAAAGALLS